MDLPTKWTGWPPKVIASSNPVDPAVFQQGINYYTWFIQAWIAFIWRQRALGNNFWPRPAHIHGQGKVASVTDNKDGSFTITDGSDPPQEWTTSGAPDWSGKLWAGGSADSTPWRPTSFDCIIDFGDGKNHTKFVRCHVVDNTTGDVDQSTDSCGVVSYTIHSRPTLKVTAYTDYVTARVIESINAAGKDYYLISAGGLGSSSHWIADKDYNLSRLPDWPNDSEEDRGTVEKVYTDESESTVDKSRLRLVSEFDYVPAGDKWKDEFELFVYDEDSVLRRVIITGSVGDIVSFTEQTWTADGGGYIVLKKGGSGFPARSGDPSPPNSGYYGVRENWLVSAPWSAIGSFPIVAAENVDFPDADEEINCPDCDVEPELCHHDTFMLDVWSTYTNVCGVPDKAFSPFFFKSPVALCASIEGSALNWIPPLNYPVAGRNAKQHFTKALFYEYCGINSGQSPVLDKDGGGHYHAAVDAKYNSQLIYYTLLKQTKYRNNAGMVRLDGSTVAVNGKIDLGTGLYNAADEAADPTHFSDVGQTVYWSAGMTREYPNMVRWLDDKVHFVRDVDSSPGGLGGIFPPEVVDFAESGCFGVGDWESRAKSTNLMRFDPQGRVVEDGPAIADLSVGTLVLYMGDNWTYPIEPATKSNTPDMEDYYHGRAESRHRKEIDQRLKAETSGTITEVLPGNLLRDENKNWWRFWYDGDVLRTQTLTATDGSSTTFIDDTKASGEGNCWFQVGRFPALAAPYTDFIAKISKAGGGKQYLVPITDCDPGVVSLTFDAVGDLSVEAGDTAEIPEPNVNLNRFKGRKITITRNDGTKFTKVVRLSGKDILDADWGEPLQVGWKYKIQEFLPGMTLRLNADREWEIPTGEDTRPGANGFKKNPFNNSPDWVRAYGLPRHFDNFQSVRFWTEVFKMLNALYMIEVGGGWKNIVYWGTASGHFTASGVSGTLTDTTVCDHSQYPATTETVLSTAWAGITSFGLTAIRFPVTSSDNEGSYTTVWDSDFFGDDDESAEFTIGELARRQVIGTSYSYSTVSSLVSTYNDDSASGLFNTSNHLRTIAGEVGAGIPPHAWFKSSTCTHWDDGAGAWTSSADLYAFSPSAWTFDISRAAAHLTGQTNTLLPFKARCFSYAQTPSSGADVAGTVQFNANGDDVIDSAWHLFDTITVPDNDKQKEVWSVKVGNTNSGASPASDTPTLSPGVEVSYTDITLGGFCTGDCTGVDCTAQVYFDPGELPDGVTLCTVTIKPTSGGTVTANSVSANVDGLEVDSLSGCPPTGEGGEAHIAIKVGACVGYEIIDQVMTFDFSATMPFLELPT